MKRKTMVQGEFGRCTATSNFGAAFLTALTLGFGATCGCSAVVDAEMFSHSNAELVEHMGESCDLGAVGENETVVDEHQPTCEPGYCVGQGGQPWTEDDRGICSCRCDGPEGTGPLCECADGFECKALIRDFSLADSHLVGSYCVPEQ